MCWRGNRPQSSPPTANELALSSSAVQGLGPVLCFSGKKESFGQTTQFHRLLESLSSWRPKAGASEYSYLLELQRRLERALPLTAIEREKRLGGESRARADLVLGDSILIETKKGFRSTATVDRAIAQMSRYAHYWNRGPLVLLLLETDSSDLEGETKRALTQLHLSSQTLTVVVPTSRSSRSR